MQRSLRREVLATLIETSRHLRAYVDARAHRLGLTGAQVRVLARLRRGEGMTQAALAADLEMRPISLGSLIDKLARQDLVERRSDGLDRRVHRLHLTPKGAALAGKLDQFREEVAGELLSTADDGGLEIALSVLSALKRRLKEPEGIEPVAPRTELHEAAGPQP